MNEVTMYSGRESKEGGLLIELHRVLYLQRMTSLIEVMKLRDEVSNSIHVIRSPTSLVQLRNVNLSALPISVWPIPTGDQPTLYLSTTALPVTAGRMWTFEGGVKPANCSSRLSQLAYQTLWILLNSFCVFSVCTPSSTGIGWSLKFYKERLVRRLPSWHTVPHPSVV